MKKSQVPRGTTWKMKCKKCGKPDIETQTGECRFCNPTKFYKEFPSQKKK